MDDLLKPNQILQYDEKLGQENLNDPNKNWCKEETDNIGEDDVKTEG